MNEETHEKRPPDSERPDETVEEEETSEPAGGTFEIDLENLTEEEVLELLDRARQSEERLDKLQRLQAEFENYRKRMAKEATQINRWARRDLVLDILPIVDDLQRALASAGEEAPSTEVPLREGVKMVLGLLLQALRKHGVEPVEAVGRPFDPAVHEAVGSVETAETPPGHVVHEVTRGYTMEDLVVRASRVLVARAPEKEGAEEGNS